MHSNKKNNLTLAAICLSSLMFGLEISSVPVLLPSLEKLLHGSFTDVQWIMNAYTIACTTVLMATGTLADRYGRKLIFIIGLSLFGITSLLCGLATNMPLLIISRFLQGLGGGIMLICQIAILSHQFQEGPQRSKAFAMWGIIFGIGLGFGPLIGGLILSFSSWEWVFLVHFPLSILTLCLALAGISESKNTKAQRLDVWGMISLSLAVFALIYFIIQGPVLGFGSTTALLILTCAAFAFLLFLYAEKTFPQPMFDFTVFKVRNFSGAITGSIGMNFCFWPFMIYLPIYFQGVLGYSSLVAGTALLAYTLPTLVVPPLAERLLLKYQPGIVIPFGLFSIGLGFIFMWLGIRAEHPGWLSMLPGTLLSGIGLGFCNTPVTNTTTGSVSADRAGMASGIDMSARLITLAINIALMGLVLSKGITTHLKATLESSFNASQLQELAEKIAAGNNGFGNEGQAALSYGFELLTLFSGTGVWILAILSFYLFKPNLRSVKE